MFRTLRFSVRTHCACCHQVLFSAFGPLAVTAGGTFPLSVWAYLREMKEQVHAAATTRGNTTRGETTRDFVVRAA
jgi:hypothetical protein